MSSDIKAAQPGIEAAVGGMAGALQSAFSGLMALGAGSSLVGMLYKAGEFEQTVIAFETMIGSVEETRKTLVGLTEFAAKTPFEMPEILQAARGLIQFGERGDDLMKTLHMLGNAASGSSTSFGFLALVFNQVRGVGKLLTQDFRQLSTRGILSLADIAKYYGVTTEAAQKMLSAGQISFEDLKKILESLSKEGGRFYNLMERQSTSLLGLWSTLKDSINLVKREIGTGLMPITKQIETVMINMSEAVREWVTQNRNLATGLALIATAAISLPAIGIVIKSLQFAFSGMGPVLLQIVTLMFSIKGILIGTTVAVVVYGIVEAFKKLGLTMDHVKAGLTLVGDLFRSISQFIIDAWGVVSQFIIDAWGVVWDYLAGLWAKIPSIFVNPFAGAFETILGYLDTMLGSWQGFGAGIVQIATQISLSVQALWEGIKDTFSSVVSSMKGMWASVLGFMTQRIIEFARLFPTLGKGLIDTEAVADAVRNRHVIEAKAIKNQQADIQKQISDMKKEGGHDVQKPTRVLAPGGRHFTMEMKSEIDLLEDKWNKLDDQRKRLSAPVNVEDAMRALQEEAQAETDQSKKGIDERRKADKEAHEKRMGEIGQESIESTKKWLEAMGKLPTLSGNFKAAIDAELKKLEKPGLPVAPKGAGIDAANPNMATKKKEWAFQGTVAAGNLGRQIQDALLKPDDKNLAEAKMQNAKLDKANENLVAIKDKLPSRMGMLA